MNFNFHNIIYIIPRLLFWEIIAGSETNCFSWQALLCIQQKWMSSAILETWHLIRWLLKSFASCHLFWLPWSNDIGKQHHPTLLFPDNSWTYGRTQVLYTSLLPTLETCHLFKTFVSHISSSFFSITHGRSVYLRTLKADFCEVFWKFK